MKIETLSGKSIVHLVPLYLPNGLYKGVHGMKKEDIVTKEGIDASFMSWLWNKDRQKYTLIMLGHLELITEQLVREFVDAGSEE